MSKKALYITVYGKVQGVYFRAFTREKASQLGIKGFVKNLPDGSVEVYAEGEEDALSKLINYLKKGPEWAEVENLDIQETTPEKKYENFEIIH